MVHLLKVEDLQTNFYTESGIVKAVNKVSFSLGENETIGIAGESGSGKSATALSLLRLIQPPTGETVGGSIFVEGVDILKLPLRRMRGLRGNIISMIFQDPMTSLNPVFTIGNQIMETLMIHQKISKREARKRAIELLEMTHIPAPEKRLNDYPFQFSGGMKQRTMIAIALACRPKILIADEPTTALDVTIQAQVLSLINELKKSENTSVLIITHDLGVIAEMAEKVMIMYAGKIVEFGSVNDIFYKPKHPYTMGLLKSIPKIESGSDEELYQIRGNPPNLLKLEFGCSFKDRCEYRKDICSKTIPELRSIKGNRQAACFLYH